MEQEIVTIQTIANDEFVNVAYSDDDIVIFDTVKQLVDSSVPRINMNLLTVCTDGKAQCQMNGHLIEIGRSQVVVCPPNIAISDLLVSPDFKFRAMLFTNRMLQSFLREKMSVWNDMMYVRRTHIWTMKEKDVEFFNHFYEMLRSLIDDDGNVPYRTEIIQSLLRGAFLGICGRFKQQMTDVEPRPMHASDNIFQRFLELVNNSKVKHRTVESYASELCITPKYLSFVCKKNSGKTANAWITEHVLEDIRYYLKQTDYTIKQVCNLMGFPNPSFFGKYVKEHFGVTPSQLRSNTQAQHQGD